MPKTFKVTTYYRQSGAISGIGFSHAGAWFALVAAIGERRADAFNAAETAGILRQELPYTHDRETGYEVSMCRWLGDSATAYKVEIGEMEIPAGSQMGIETSKWGEVRVVSTAAEGIVHIAA